ncbi:MAG: hypothetical protein HYU68_13715 [Bacteroidetes bacterium]|nr:hypothetical protein [Bacteroidota bacterium]
MKTIDNNPNSPLKFSAFGQPMTILGECVNHGLILPKGKIVLERGLFILGHLETDKGRKIEAALRIPETFDYHSCAIDASKVDYFKPIRLFPNPEINGEVVVSNDLFNPYYNCHGQSFGKSEYWINPLASKIVNNRMASAFPNVDIILEDEFMNVDSKSDWDVAVLRNNKNDILHSIHKENGRIYSKYDAYRKISFDKIEDVDISVYGNGIFKFYKKINGS